MKLKNNILYPVEENLVTTILPDDKLILKCLFLHPKKAEQRAQTQPHLHSQDHHFNSGAAFIKGELKFIYIMPNLK